VSPQTRKKKKSGLDWKEFEAHLGAHGC